MKNLLIIIFAVIISLASVETTAFASGDKCTTVYGGGNVCTSEVSFTLNKLIQLPTKGEQFVDNLTINDATFSLNQTVMFQIKVKNRIRNYKTCLIFISNNESCGQLFGLGARSLLATGLLQVIILNCYTRWQLLICILSILFTPIKNSKYISYFNVEELKISASKKTTNIVIDGELVELQSPMHFINHKNKLLMISP